MLVQPFFFIPVIVALFWYDDVMFLDIFFLSLDSYFGFF